MTSRSASCHHMCPYIRLAVVTGALHCSVGKGMIVSLIEGGKERDAAAILNMYGDPRHRPTGHRMQFILISQRSLLSRTFYFSPSTRYILSQSQITNLFLSNQFIYFQSFSELRLITFYFYFTLNMRASTSVDLNLIQEGIHGVLFASDGSHPLR